MDHDPMAILFIKCIIGEPGRRSSDDTAFLMTGIQPVAELRPAIDGVEINLSDKTCECSVRNNSECQAVVVGSLLERPSDKPRRIFDIRVLVEPGKPFLQVTAVEVD